MTKSVELPESESEDEYVYDDSRYDSATDWEPNEELKAANAAYEKERARYRKRNPKEYADLPEMLIVDRTDTFIASGCEAPPLCELFGPFWRMDELSLMFAPSGVGKSILAAQISECRGRRARSCTSGVPAVRGRSRRLPACRRARGGSRARSVRRSG